MKGQGQGHDHNTFWAQHLENSWRCYCWLLDSLLWGSTVGYPSDSLASCSYMQSQWTVTAASEKPKLRPKKLQKPWPGASIVLVHMAPLYWLQIARKDWNGTVIVFKHKPRRITSNYISPVDRWRCLQNYLRLLWARVKQATEWMNQKRVRIIRQKIK